MSHNILEYSYMNHIGFGTDIKHDILDAKKNLFDNLKKEYKIIKDEYKNDENNYYKLLIYKKKKKYLLQLLMIENINKYYFFDNSAYMPDDDYVNDINKLIDTIWRLDTNKFIYDKDIRLNLQSKVTDKDSKDESPYPLFDFVNMDKLKQSSYKHFMRICNFFFSEIGITENISDYRKNEIYKFIHTLCNSYVFVYLYYFLKKRNIINSFLDFPDMIYDFWFSLYTKKKQNDTSAFEHIFIGETSHDKILGFHNWIQLWKEERIGRLNYYGHLNTINKTMPYVVNIKFSWGNNVKRSDTLFIGTSLEFEFALYMLCYYFVDKTESVSLDLLNSKIKMIVIKKNNKLLTCYPIIK
jgi:poly(U)-specific endoribonuclease